MVVVVAATVLTGASLAPTVCDSLDFQGMSGYTIVAVTSVDGEFEGCEYGKTIEFMNGTALTCSGYGYQYAYMPDPVIFAKVVDDSSPRMALTKALIGGEMYDMEAVPLND